MRVVTSVAELRDVRRELTVSEPSTRIAFVATMGALHRAHKSLMKLARQHGDLVVVSIFVNPLQFGPDEDYARYPRSMEEDLKVCRKAGVDIVFTPTVTDLFPTGRQVSVSAGAIGTVWEGASRRGHFDGMLTVVLKLLNLVDPHAAVFGQKDAQQLACIRRMVVDLNLDSTIVPAPIVREDDGLALSSRNRYLSVPDRLTAAALSSALYAAAAEETPTAAVAAAEKVLAAAAETGNLKIDYLAVVNPATMGEVPADHTGPALIIVAATVGTTRLIDNVEVDFSSSALADIPAEK